MMFNDFTMNETYTISVSKLDAAKREIEHAIRMFFNDGDTVVLHLVASSAYQILRDLGKHQKHKSNRDDFLEHVKKDKRKFVSAKLNAAYNFFHHADKDSEKTIVFNPELTQFVMWDSVLIYSTLSQEETGLMQSYKLWFYLKHKDILIDNTSEFAMQLERTSKSVSIHDKKLFLKTAEEFENERVGLT
jgi:hypothetical protein